MSGVSEAAALIVTLFLGHLLNSCGTVLYLEVQFKEILNGFVSTVSLGYESRHVHFVYHRFNRLHGHLHDDVATSTVMCTVAHFFA